MIFNAFWVPKCSKTDLQFFPAGKKKRTLGAEKGFSMVLDSTFVYNSTKETNSFGQRSSSVKPDFQTKISFGQRSSSVKPEFTTRNQSKIYPNKSSLIKTSNKAAHLAISLTSS